MTGPQGMRSIFCGIQARTISQLFDDPCHVTDGADHVLLHTLAEEVDASLWAERVLA